ncbi:MAG: S8 family serine peptidase [Anaerolineales bacterium]|nr:S8 family serine peptidase [Anaerolineales bacterium]
MAPGGDLGVDLNGDGYADGVLQQTFKTPGTFTYLFNEGTSMASPHVAGLAALLLSRNSGLTPAMVENLMVQTAKPAGSTSENGAGVIQAAAALAALGGGTTSTITPVPTTPAATPTSTATPTPTPLTPTPTLLTPTPLPICTPPACAPRRNLLLPRRLPRRLRYAMRYAHPWCNRYPPGSDYRYPHSHYRYSTANRRAAVGRRL